MWIYTGGMEQNPGENAYLEMQKRLDITAERFEEEVKKIPLNVNLNQAHFIELMVPNYKELSAIEVHNLDRQIGEFLKNAVASGYLTETKNVRDVAGMRVEDPTITYTRTEKEPSDDEKDMREAA